MEVSIGTPTPHGKHHEANTVVRGHPAPGLFRCITTFLLLACATSTLLLVGCTAAAITRQSATRVIPREQTLEPITLHPGMTAWLDELNAGISFDGIAGDASEREALVHMTVGRDDETHSLLLNVPDVPTHRTVCHPLPGSLSPWLVCLSKLVNEEGTDQITFFVSQYRQ
jgi:hypothetical protein